MSTVPHSTSDPSLSAWSALLDHMAGRAPDTEALRAICRDLGNSQQWPFTAILTRPAPGGSPARVSHPDSLAPGAALDVDALLPPDMTDPGEWPPDDHPAEWTTAGLPPATLDWHTLLVRPLRHEGVTYGALIAATAEPPPPAQRAGLHIVATQLTLALAAEHLSAELQQRAIYEDALSRITASLQQQASVHDLLHETLHGLAGVLGATRARAILQPDLSALDAESQDE